MSNLKKQIRLEFISDLYETCNLRDLGFKYLKSKGIIIRKSENLEEIIGFSSSRVNILEDTNILNITAYTHDMQFAVWKKEVLEGYPSGIIGGDLINNLFSEGPPYITFDLKNDLETRNSVFLEVVKCINTDVMKFFNICRDYREIRKNIFLPCFDIPNILSYLIFLNGMEAYDGFVDNISRVYPTLRTEIEYYKTTILTKRESIEGFEETFGNQSKAYAHDIAKILIKINDRQQKLLT